MLILESDLLFLLKENRIKKKSLAEARSKFFFFQNPSGYTLKFKKIKIKASIFLTPVTPYARKKNCVSNSGGGDR